MFSEKNLRGIKSVRSDPLQTDTGGLLYKIEYPICHQGTAPSIAEIYSFSDDVVRRNDPSISVY